MGLMPWLMSVIPATREVIRGSRFEANLHKLLRSHHQ
jgi:hypothetical protein